MSYNHAYVRGLLPGQPAWVVEQIAEEFDKYDDRIAVLQMQLNLLRERITQGGGGKYTDIISDGGMDPRDRP